MSRIWTVERGTRAGQDTFRPGRGLRNRDDDSAWVNREDLIGNTPPVRLQAAGRGRQGHLRGDKLLVTCAQMTQRDITARPGGAKSPGSKRSRSLWSRSLTAEADRDPRRRIPGTTITAPGAASCLTAVNRRSGRRNRRPAKSVIVTSAMIVNVRPDALVLGKPHRAATDRGLSRAESKMYPRPAWRPCRDRARSWHPPA